jgi:hypothetical protein
MVAVISVVLIQVHAIHTAPPNLEEKYYTIRIIRVKILSCDVCLTLAF